MTDSQPEPRRAAPASAPAPTTGHRGAPTGNDNARGRRTTTQTPPDNVPLWHRQARQVLAHDFRMGRFRNWGGDAKVPNLHGMTVSAPDPRKSRVPNPSRPYLASYDGKQTWHSSPATARAEIEAEFVRKQNAEREARLAANPLDDPLRRAALYRALKSLRGLN